MENNPDQPDINEKPETTVSEKVPVTISNPSTPPASVSAETAPAETPAPESSSATSSAATVSQSPKKKRKSLKALFVLIILAALAAAAWYGYDASKNDNTNAKTAVNKDVPLIRVGLDTPDYGKLYPDMSLSSYSYLTNAQLFEGLVRYEDKSKIAPLLATDWSNPDSTTWVFNLKSGVKFHDGHTMTAADVKYSLDKIKAQDSDFASTFASSIASVDVVNDSQVKIKTAKPDPALLNKLTFLYIVDAKAPAGSEPSQAGTGAYVIKKGTTPTTKSVQMVAFDGYHGGHVSTRAVSFGGEVDMDTLAKAYKAHKYDIVSSGLSTSASPYAGTYTFVTSEPSITFLGLNTKTTGPLQNVKVREALRYAVDAQKIGDVGGGKVKPQSQVVPESIPGYNPAIPVYKRDVAKSKKLLADAGYPNGLALRLSYGGQATAVANEMKKELADAGVTLNLDQHKDFDEFIDYFLGGKAEMYYILYSSDILDGLDIYDSTVRVPTMYASTPLDTVLDKAATSVNPAERLKLLQQAATIVDTDIPVVPLSTKDSVWLMDKDYSIKQDMASAYLSVYFYKVSNK